MSRTDGYLHPHIALLVRQIEDLMELHNRLVAEGRVPAFKLMGIHNSVIAM